MQWCTEQNKKTGHLDNGVEFLYTMYFWIRIRKVKNRKELSKCSFLMKLKKNSQYHCRGPWSPSNLCTYTCCHCKFLLPLVLFLQVIHDNRRVTPPPHSHPHPPFYPKIQYLPPFNSFLQTPSRFSWPNQNLCLGFQAITNTRALFSTLRNFLQLS